MKKYFLIVIILIIISVSWLFYYLAINQSFNSQANINAIISLKNKNLNLGAISNSFNKDDVKNINDKKIVFSENFNKNSILEESGKIEESDDHDWSVSSGAYLFYDGAGKTIFGDLSFDNKWRSYYLKDNPTDTDNGFHPQNIFRLVMRKKILNYYQEAYFKIKKYNLSDSLERRASNGLLFFNRYQDGNNLYYTGIRVDGTAVIKKKINGVYYTLAQKFFYDSSAPYNRDANPNLIPIQKWIGLRSEVKTSHDNTVSIKVFIDKDKTGNWTLVAEATDDGKTYGGSAILSEGYAGIRTDFMDVEFDDYKVVKL